MADEKPDNWELAVLRIVGACLVAMVLSLAMYFLLSTPAAEENGLIGLTFLIFMPTFVCAFIAYAIDPFARLGFARYAAVPAWTGIAMVLVSIFALKEGAICIVMLLPFWGVFGLAGSLATYYVRRRIHNGRAYCAMLLAMPFIGMQVEPMLPVPEQYVTVTRSVVVDATAERIWPLLRGIPDVRGDEGRWNISQDVLNIPRPVGATLSQDGLGATRHARWTQGVDFRETITEWQPGRRIGWRFVFDDKSQWHITDRHLMPDSAYFKVLSGGYTLEPAGAGKMRVTIDTRYWMRTRVNAYARVWGELVLGDLEDNLLALIKARAEG